MYLSTWLTVLILALSIHSILFLALGNQKCSQESEKNNILFQYILFHLPVLFSSKKRFQVSLRFPKTKEGLGKSSREFYYSC